MRVGDAFIGQGTAFLKGCLTIPPSREPVPHLLAMDRFEAHPNPDPTSPHPRPTPLTCTIEPKLLTPPPPSANRGHLLRNRPL